jgi:hypothetical protein
MELLVKLENLTSYIYVPTFGNAESRLFLFAAQYFKIESIQKVILCHSLCKHFASYQGYSNYRLDLIPCGKVYPIGTVRPIYRTGTPLPSKHPILYIFQQIYVLNVLKNSAHSPFFSSSKCRLFQNANFFWFQYYSRFTYRMC